MTEEMMSSGRTSGRPLAISCVFIALALGVFQWTPAPHVMTAVMPGLRPLRLELRPLQRSHPGGIPRLLQPHVRRVIALRSTEATDLEAIKRMRIKDIKAELQKRGVGCDDCFEKGDLVARLVDALQRPPADSGIVLPMPRVLGQAGVMGPDVAVDDAAEYFIFTARFPKSVQPEEEAELLIDTAATVSLISPAAAALFGGRRTGYTASGTSAGGEAATAGYQVSLGPITIADQPFSYDFRPVVADVPLVTPRTRGILGLDFLSQFDVLFDFTAAKCSLFPRGSRKNSPLAKGMTAVPYRVLPLGLLVADVRLVLNTTRGSSIVLGILDTGAASSVINWRAAATVGLAPASPAVVDTGLLMMGQDGKLMSMREAPVSVAIPGDWPGPGPTIKVGIADLPGFLNMGIADKPVMLIGADVLNQYGTLLLSMADRTLWLPPYPRTP